MAKKRDLKGMKFGSLFVWELYGKDSFNRKIWLCLCMCGKEKPVSSRHLLSGATKTCGCRIGCILAKPNLGKKGPNCPTWKGGSFINQDGYRMVYVGDGKYEFEHRIVYKQNYGEIRYDHVIHHINEIKTDNRIENLKMLSRREHALIHEFGE